MVSGVSRISRRASSILNLRASTFPIGSLCLYKIPYVRTKTDGTYVAYEHFSSFLGVRSAPQMNPTCSVTCCVTFRCRIRLKAVCTWPMFYQCYSRRRIAQVCGIAKFTDAYCYAVNAVQLAKDRTMSFCLMR